MVVVPGGWGRRVGGGGRPPGGWTPDGRHDVLLGRAGRTRWADSGWWWPAVLAVLAVLVLLALWWLTAVLRRRRLAEVRVDTGDGEGALLRGRALEGVLAADAARLDGVAHAQATLSGRREAPEARVRLRLEPDVDPGTALHDLTARSLTHARDSAGLAKLPAEVRLGAVKRRAERVT
ncbi:alkaline shock response membrane anchor protein AmaP [Streptomyces sp. NPDC058964]|uniref:alkaline shock response membrane anchor protein AmaP n=1 Tax=Streptomyces sp. NPDC058964 TaxID=3346681 RepID=UPI0036C39C58